ncbi:MAG TPA: hypothetical protein VH298_10755 [Jatrophihabitans sp.]|nr:hypothetical protein [Jatrophihabitans sp.]
MSVSGMTVLADSDTGKGSPIGFLVILVLVIAVYFLYRSMNRHLKKVPDSFEPPPPVGEPDDPRQLLSEQPPVDQRPAQPPVESGDADVTISPHEPGHDRP